MLVQSCGARLYNDVQTVSNKTRRRILDDRRMDNMDSMYSSPNMELNTKDTNKEEYYTRYTWYLRSRQ